MVKTIISGEHPETKEQVVHEFEAEAICTVAVKKVDGHKVEVNSSIMGGMDLRLTESMIEALLGACKDILKDIDPIVAALILSKGLKRCEKEEETDGMAGESSEPQRPSEQ